MSEPRAEGRDRRRRQRRPLDRQRAPRPRPRGAAHRARDPGAEDRDRARAPSWVQGDACEIATLEAADLDTFDVVVAATGDDKANLVLSLLAKTEYAVDRVIARVNHPKNEWLFDAGWGVDTAVSTPRLLTALVEEAVGVSDLVRLMSFQRRAPPWSRSRCRATRPSSGARSARSSCPAGTAVVAVLRESRLVHPDRRHAARGRRRGHARRRPRTEARLSSPRWCTAAADVAAGSAATARL